MDVYANATIYVLAEASIVEDTIYVFDNVGTNVSAEAPTVKADTSTMGLIISTSTTTHIKLKVNLR